MHPILDLTARLENHPNVLNVCEKQQLLSEITEK